MKNTMTISDLLPLFQAKFYLCDEEEMERIILSAFEQDEEEYLGDLDDLAEDVGCSKRDLVHAADLTEFYPELI